MTAKTLAGLLREFNIRIIPIGENHRRTARQTCAGATLARIFELRGYMHLRDVVMTFCETSSANKRAMTGPALWATSDVLRARPAWFGTIWLEVMDTVDIGAIFELAASNRRVAAPRCFIAAVLFERLRPHFPDQVRVGARRRRPADQPAPRMAA